MKHPTFLSSPAKHHVSHSVTKFSGHYSFFKGTLTFYHHQTRQGLNLAKDKGMDLFSVCGVSSSRMGNAGAVVAYLAALGRADSETVPPSIPLIEVQHLADQDLEKGKLLSQIPSCLTTTRSYITFLDSTLAAGQLMYWDFLGIISTSPFMERSSTWSQNVTSPRSQQEFQL